MNGLIHSHDHMAVVSHIQSKCACYLLLLIWIGFPYPYHQMGCTRALSALGVTWPRDGTFPCSVVVGETKLCHHFGKHSSSQTKPWVQFFILGLHLHYRLQGWALWGGSIFQNWPIFLKYTQWNQTLRTFCEMQSFHWTSGWGCVVFCSEIFTTHYPDCLIMRPY